VAALALAVALAAPGAARAATATFRPVADGYVRAERPRAVAGTGKLLWVAARPDLRVAYLRFDVRLPRGSRLRTAQLHLTVRGRSGPGGLALAGAAATSWRERTLTWRRAPRRSRPRARAVARPGTALALDAGGAVTRGGEVTLALIARRGTRIALASREAGAAGPRLVVTYDPPSAPGVTGAGLGPPSPPPPPPPPPPPVTTGPPAPPGWHYVLDDEFAGTSIDTAHWTDHYWASGNSFYDPANVTLQDGVLHLWAASPSSASMIQTLGKLDLSYGRIEIAADGPYGQGLWPALWLRPTALDREYPEVDLLEMWMVDNGTAPFDKTTAWLNYHWLDSADKHHQSQTTVTGPDYTAGFHRFTLEWEPGAMRWYVDDQLQKTVTGPTVAAEPMFLVLSMQVGAWWLGSAGEPSPFTHFPNDLAIDYVRVFQR
jgi:hypothetical protein